MRYSVAVVAAAPVPLVVKIDAVLDAPELAVSEPTAIAVKATPSTVNTCAVSVLAGLATVTVSDPNTTAVAPCARLILVPDNSMAKEPGTKVWSPKTYSVAALAVAVTSPNVEKGG